jgi:regulatory protein
MTSRREAARRNASPARFRRAEDGGGADDVTPTGGGRRKDVHDRALGLLAVRARSRRELQQRLTSAGYGTAEIDETLERLAGVGLVDDEAFALAFAEHAVGTRGSGRRAVESALFKKGVPRETIELVLAEVSGEVGDEFERALDVARARACRLRGQDRATAFRKLFSFLARRGYGASVAREAAMRALDVDEAADTDQVDGARG